MSKEQMHEHDEIASADTKEAARERAMVEAHASIYERGETIAEAVIEEAVGEREKVGAVACTHGRYLSPAKCQCWSPATHQLLGGDPLCATHAWEEALRRIGGFACRMGALLSADPKASRESLEHAWALLCDRIGDQTEAFSPEGCSLEKSRGEETLPAKITDVLMDPDLTDVEDLQKVWVKLTEALTEEFTGDTISDERWAELARVAGGFRKVLCPGKEKEEDGVAG